jgi:hypothetical protein
MREKKMKNRVNEFFKSSDGKFATKRQASKYLNQYGSVYKTEQNIPISFSKRTFVEIPPKGKSLRKKVKKSNK